MLSKQGKPLRFRVDLSGYGDLGTQHSGKGKVLLGAHEN